jgi:hypothetical protein
VPSPAFREEGSIGPNVKTDEPKVQIDEAAIFVVLHQALWQIIVVHGHLVGRGNAAAQPLGPPMATLKRE